MYSQAPKKLAGTQLDPKNICNQLPCDNYLPKTFKNVKLILFTSYHSRNANSFPLATKALVLHLDLGYAAFRQDAAASISTTIPHCVWTENTAQMEYCDENLRTFFFSVVISIHLKNTIGQNVEYAQIGGVQIKMF